MDRLKCATMSRNDGSRYVFCTEEEKMEMKKNDLGRPRTPGRRFTDPEFAEKVRKKIEDTKEKVRLKKRGEEQIEEQLKVDNESKKDIMKKEDREELLKKEMIDTFKKINPDRLPYSFEELIELLEEYENTEEDYELYTSELKNLKKRAKPKTLSERENLEKEYLDQYRILVGEPTPDYIKEVKKNPLSLLKKHIKENYNKEELIEDGFGEEDWDAIMIIKKKYNNKL
jgi:hypothetical protein